MTSNLYVSKILLFVQMYYSQDHDFERRSTGGDGHPLESAGQQRGGVPLSVGQA